MSIITPVNYTKPREYTKAKPIVPTTTVDQVMNQMDVLTLD